jgi:hypothetical protein
MLLRDIKCSQATVVISRVDVVSRLGVILCFPYIPQIGRGRSQVVTSLLFFSNPPGSNIV